MAVEWMQVALVVSHPDGAVVTKDELASLDPEEGGLALRVVADRSKWQSALVLLLREDIEAHASDAEPSEAFARAVAIGFESAARWIAPRAAKIRALAAAGLRLRVIATGWIDHDQLDLDLPPAFLAACAEAGLAFQLVTNE
jgi:hypothetical protein